MSWKIKKNYGPKHDEEDAKYDVVIPHNTEYAEAIGTLLRQIGPLGPYSRYEAEATGCYTQGTYQFGADSDWMESARKWAEGINWSLVCLDDGTWTLRKPVVLPKTVRRRVGSGTMIYEGEEEAHGCDTPPRRPAKLDAVWLCDCGQFWIFDSHGRWNQWPR